MKKISLLLITAFLSTLFNTFVYAEDTATKNNAKAELSSIFSLYDEFDYSENAWAELKAAYNAGLTAIDNASNHADIYSALNDAAENMITVRHGSKIITACISIENLVLQKGYIVFPEFVKVPKYQPVSKVIQKVMETKNSKVARPLLYSGTLEDDFEITSVYQGIETNENDSEEVKVPNYLYSNLGQYLPESKDKTYLNSGDYTSESCFVYSVNNKFPNVKASAIPVIDEDVIRVQFSVFGKGADVGASLYGLELPLITPADKSELYIKLAEIIKDNDIDLLLSDENNKKKFNDAIVVAELVNLSQKAVDKALDKIESLEPVTTPPSLPEPDKDNSEQNTPEVEEKPLPVIFSDVSDGHFAKEAIDFFSSNGILTGRPDGTFGINDNITRGEFATILARYESNETVSDMPFVDVEQDAWYAKGVYFCYKTGITTGKSENEFMPDAPITRQELATMLYRYITYKGIEKETEIKPAFADNDVIDTYAREAVEFLKNSGIINGRENNTFSPFETATRGETSKMFYNVIK